MTAGRRARVPERSDWRQASSSARERPGLDTLTNHPRQTPCARLNFLRSWRLDPASSSSTRRCSVWYQGCHDDAADVTRPVSCW